MKSQDKKKKEKSIKLSKMENQSSKLKGFSQPTEMNEIITDSRFKHIGTDPRYREASRIKRSIKLDNRFSSVLTDDRFYEKSTMDSRGRPKNFSTKEDLKKFYHLSNEDSSCGESDDSEEDGEKKLKKKIEVQDIEVGKQLDKSESDISKSILESFKDPECDYARGGPIVFSDSSVDDSSSSEDSDDSDIFEWGDLDGDAQWDVNGCHVEETRRFAVCNMDWDRIKAADLMVLFSSFTPPSGSINSVKIYPSDYGKEKLKEEEENGPQELLRMIKKNKKKLNDLERLRKISKGNFEETDQATKDQLEILRRYQRNRLKYYYACIDCDSVETSKAVYCECDRQVFEGAGVTLDLRYIPDEMEFDEDAHDVCTSIPNSYESNLFVNTALADSKPTFTWEEGDHNRKNVLSKAMSKALKNEKYDESLLKQFVASGSSDEEKSELEDESGSDTNNVDREERYAKFRALISSISDKEKGGSGSNAIDKEMEFDPDETDDNSESDGESSHNEDKEQSDINPFQKYLDKRRNKKKEFKKAQLERKQRLSGGLDMLQLDQEKGEESKTTKKKKGKGKNLKETEISVNDESAKKDLELLVMNENENENLHFNMRQIVDDNKKKTKRKLKQLGKQKIEEKKNAKKQDDFKVDVSDSRFSTLMTSGDYNIDPSHPSFKRTKAMDKVIDEVQVNRIGNETENSTKRSLDNEKDLNISGLLKKIRKKTSK